MAISTRMIRGVAISTLGLGLGLGWTVAYLRQSVAATRTVEQPLVRFDVDLGPGVSLGSATGAVKILCKARVLLRRWIGSPIHGGKRLWSTFAGRLFLVAHQHALPVINVWYGDSQNFGQNGIPQQWVNILGDVSDFYQVTSLTYSLNGGPRQNLWMGENEVRLVAPGNFNVEIDYSSLQAGPNNVRITAVDSLGGITTHDVTVNLVSGQTWLSNYTVDWGAASNIQNVAQIVDGLWQIQPDGTVRTMQTGYDRLIDIGDRTTWTNYVATAEITMNALDGCGFAVGIVAGWQGHTTIEYGVPLPDQPRVGHPYPGAGAYTLGDGAAGLQIGANTASNPEAVLARDTSGRTLQTGVKYIFKFQAQQNITGGSHYSFKVWSASGTEPANWDLQADGELSHGSILLYAHKADISIGKVTVTGL
jgi:hypothetical protein